MRWTKKVALAALVSAILAAIMFTASYLSAADGEDLSALDWIRAVAGGLSDNGAGPGRALPVDDRQQIPAAGVETIEVSTRKAELRITAVEGGEIRAAYEGGVTWRGLGDPEPEVTQMSVSRDSDKLTIAVGTDESFLMKRYSSQAVLTVQVPRDFDGDLRVSTVSGRVDLTGYEEEGAAPFALDHLEADAISGDLSIAGVSARSVEADSTSGDILMTRSAAAKLKVDSTSGDVKIDSATGRVEVDTTSGDIALSLTGEISANVDSISGDVSIELSPSSGADIRVETISGDISSSLPMTVHKKEDSVLRGKLGDGHGKIRVDTTSGDVSLKSTLD